MTTAARLVQHLEQEIQWIRALNILLAQESELLISRNYAELEKLSQEKIELSNKIEASVNGRLKLMNAAGIYEEPQKVFQAFIRDCQESEAELIRVHSTVLADEISQCNKLNLINGQVIATNLHTRKSIVNMLTGNDSAAATYTANGNVITSVDRKTDERDQMV